LLREPIASLQRADAVIITRADQVSASTLDDIRNEIKKQTSKEIAEVHFVPTQLVDADSKTEPLSFLASRRALAFCAIGNPEGFRSTLQDMGQAKAADQLRCYPDHYHYTGDDVASLQAWGTANNADLLLTTRKDLVKLKCHHPAGLPMFAVDLDVKFSRGEAQLRDEIESICRNWSTEFAG